MKSKIIKLIGVCLFLGLFIYWIVGFVRMKPDQILSKNSEYIIVKEFTWNNRDSCVYRYKSDKIYTATVINKERHSHYVGLPGKGGHTSTSYYITVVGNNTEHRIQSSNLYHKYNKGDRVKVKEVWYPRHDVTVY